VVGRRIGDNVSMWGRAQKGFIGKLRRKGMKV
jgi:hypothetical protein